jgi:hypothetical protein
MYQLGVACIATCIPVAFILGVVVCFAITGKAVSDLEAQITELHDRNHRLASMMKGHTALTGTWKR